MGFIKRTLVEMVIIASLATGLALGMNAVRVTGSIKVNKAYFATSKLSRTKLNDSSVEQVSTATSTINSSTPAPSDPADHRTVAPVEDVEAHTDHEYQKIKTEGVAELLDDPNTEMGLNLILDARDADHFEEGHIPGAIHLNYYELENVMDEILQERLAAAEKIVVYCNGGQCSDSIYMCRDLIGEYDVDYDHVYLYGGGWKAWTAKGQPVATGPE